MVILSTNKKNTKKIGEKLFPRKKVGKNVWGVLHVYKNVSRRKFLIPPSRKIMILS